MIQIAGEAVRRVVNLYGTFSDIRSGQRSPTLCLNQLNSNSYCSKIISTTFEMISEQDYNICCHGIHNSERVYVIVRGGVTV